jgi:transposase-like protein
MRQNGTAFALEAQARPTTVGGWTLTYIRVKGKWVYLYRAVDSSGAFGRIPSVGEKRLEQRRSAFRAKALGGPNHPAPRVINTDKHAGYPPATRATQSRGCF